MPKPAARRSIVAKVNSLLDKDIIQALYRASQAGVHIELIVRGACALRPGVRGVSSRIRVRSVVGPLSRAQPDFRLRQWRRHRSLSGQRRLDAAQPPRARGSHVPPERPGALPESLLRNSAAVFCGHGKGALPSVERVIIARAPTAGRSGLHEWHPLQRAGILYRRRSKSPGRRRRHARVTDRQAEGLAALDILSAKWAIPTASEPEPVAE